MCLGHILMKTETSKWGPLSFYGLRLLWLCSACWRDGYDYSGIYFHIVSWWCMVYQSANSTWALCSLFKLGIQSNFRTVAFWKIFRLHNILLFKIFFSFQPCMMKISEFHFHQKVLISSIYQYNYVLKRHLPVHLLFLHISPHNYFKNMHWHTCMNIQ